MLHRLLRTPHSLIAVALLLPAGRALSQDQLGLFEKHADVGGVMKPGAVVYDPAQQSYTVSGGGENMWAALDAFHYVWKQASGDVSLVADLRWVGTGGNAHRKACLMIRQTLDADSPYADAVVHGDGLTSLQYREERGGPTREIQSNVSAPRRIRIDKEGDDVWMSIGSDKSDLRPAGGSFRIKFGDSFYVGLAVCAHDNKAMEQAIFSNVEIGSPPKSEGRRVVESTLERIAIASTDRRVVYHTRDHIEAPNWSRDGSYLLFNGGGRMHKLPVAGGQPEAIETGSATRINNDHGISPDGTQLVISNHGADNRSLIYLLPIAGGVPRLVTPQGPSYWHGWSPDGKTLAFCGQRNGEFDIYTIPAEGGEERRLTTAAGLDDGPDYSPDGKLIYFNSDRTGLMQLWQMQADGSEQKQLTSDEFNNWFPHPSPNGRWIVFLSYDKSVKGHPANKDVLLRLMPAAGGEPRTIAKLFGGQGTINVPSWSPDSNHVAFVSYRLVAP